MHAYVLSHRSRLLRRRAKLGTALTHMRRLERVRRATAIRIGVCQAMRSKFSHRIPAPSPSPPRHASARPGAPPPPVAKCGGSPEPRSASEGERGHVHASKMRQHRAPASRGGGGRGGRRVAGASAAAVSGARRARGGEAAHGSTSAIVCSASWRLPWCVIEALSCARRRAGWREQEAKGPLRACGWRVRWRIPRRGTPGRPSRRRARGRRRRRPACSG